LMSDTSFRSELHDNASSTIIPAMRKLQELPLKKVTGFICCHVESGQFTDYVGPGKISEGLSSSGAFTYGLHHERQMGPGYSLKNPQCLTPGV
jgi:hypothetical protein